MKPAPKSEEEGLIALIVGIDGYKDRTFKSLHCAVNDAVYLTETLQKVWQGRKVHIKTLIWPSLNKEQAKNQKETWGIELPKDASEVTRKSILSEVREGASLAQESDTFIFYFAGHGVLIDEEPALIMIRAGKTTEGIEKLKIKDIQQAAAECPSRKKVMILDCCQSSAPGIKRVEEYKNLKDFTQGWSILLSSSPGEGSLEDQYYGDSRNDYLQQGVFTAALVEGLRGEAIGSSGLVSLADLAYFVGKRVPVEYQERVLTMIKILSKNGVKVQTDTRGRGASSQNPVLLSDAVAMGGQYQITLAPVYVSTSQSARRKTPTKNFIKNWVKFLIGQWPITFPFRAAFRLAALVYAATMMLTVLLQCQKAIDATIFIFSTGVGLGSAFIWWITLPFAVAVNEDRWHIGGYLSLIFYLIWHCIVGFGFAWICGTNQITGTGVNRIISLGVELFFIYGVVVVYGCNTSQVIIALAESIRTDERREIRQAIRAFQEFKYTKLGVNLYSFVPNVSFRPDFYFYL